MKAIAIAASDSSIFALTDDGRIFHAVMRAEEGTGRWWTELPKLPESSEGQQHLDALRKRKR